MHKETTPPKCNFVSDATFNIFEQSCIINILLSCFVLMEQFVF